VSKEAWFIRLYLCENNGKKKGIDHMSTGLGMIREMRKVLVEGQRIGGKSQKSGFKKWMRSVVEEVDVVTGMDIDILSEMPWKDWWEKGLSPASAVEKALDIAEGEEDTFDASRYLGGTEHDEEDEDDEDDELSELSLIKNTYKRWTDKIDKKLKKVANTTLVSIKKAGKVSNPVLHRMFQNQTTVEMAARMLLKAGGVAENRGVSLRKSRLAGRGKELDIIDELRGLMSEFDMDRPKRRSSVSSEVEKFMEEMDMDDAKERVIEKEGESSVASVVPVVEKKAAVSPNMDVAQAVAAINDSKAVEEVKKVDEASVMGGDFGRWGPATVAAGSSGRGLASAIAKVTGLPYMFRQEGNAQSAEVGSDLWFGINTEKSGNINYYLGIKIKGDKDDPTWDVMLKKGKGLGSATSVVSKKGLKTSELKGAISGLRDGLNGEGK
jgi:hypothetical protein